MCICIYLFEEGGREVMGNPRVRGEHHQLMAQREGNSLSHHFCFACLPSDFFLYFLHNWQRQHHFEEGEIEISSYYQGCKQIPKNPKDSQGIPENIRKHQRIPKISSQMTSKNLKDSNRTSMNPRNTQKSQTIPSPEILNLLQDSQEPQGFFKHLHWFFSNKTWDVHWFKASMFHPDFGSREGADLTSSLVLNSSIWFSLTPILDGTTSSHLRKPWFYINIY